MAATAVTYRCAKTAALVRCALYLGKNNVLSAMVVLVLATATVANNHDIALQQLNRQTIDSILLKWKTPCLLYSRWMDCSLLFGDYFVANSNTKTLPELLKLVNYRYKQPALFHNIEFTTCANSVVCAVTAPMRPSNGITSLRSSLQQLYDVPLYIAPSSITDILPHKDTNEPLLPSNQDTDKSMVDVDMVPLLADYMLKTSNPQNQNNNPKENNVLPTVSITATTSSAPTSTRTDENEHNVGTMPVDLSFGDLIPSVVNNSLKASTESRLEVSTEDEAPPTVDSTMPRIVDEHEQNLGGKTDGSSISDLGPSVVSYSPKPSTASTISEDSIEYDVVLPPPSEGHFTTARTTESEEYVNVPLFGEILTQNDSVEHSTTPRLLTKDEINFELFKETLDRLERKFLLSTFTKLTAISPVERRVNGISFIQSGLFLHLLLISLSTEVDQPAVREIEDCLGLYASNEDRIGMLKQIVSKLPESSRDLKFRWSSRLVVGRALDASSVFRSGAAAAMNLTLSQLNTTDPAAMTKALNDMVDADSGGTMRDTFEEAELARGACGAALATLYVRARWRVAPTLLNGTRAFRDAAARRATRATRFFRVNDRVRYADLRDWDAEAIEIPYATPGLSLLVVVPRAPALGELVARVARAGVADLLARARPLRAAVTLPLYTLRMTLLLPNKLQDMGMSSLVDVNNTDCGSLKLSHAVQRLMFWAEAGRNAYKDDGIEWDPRPDVEVLVDRPYLFFVRWNNVTLMTGNFVL